VLRDALGRRLSSPSPERDVFHPWGEPSSRPWNRPSWTGPWGEPLGYGGPSYNEYGSQGQAEAIDKLVNIVDGLAQDLREERAARNALEVAFRRKRRAIEHYDEDRPTKNRVLAIAPATGALTPETATPDGSYDGSHNGSSESESELRKELQDKLALTGEQGHTAARGLSHGFSSVMSTGSPQGPKNALVGCRKSATGLPLPPQTWDWPLSNKERKALTRAGLNDTPR